MTVNVDPARNFGSPSVKGIRTDIVAERVAAGDSTAMLCADYGLSRRDILEACWWETMWPDLMGVPVPNRIEMRRYREHWLTWAEDAFNVFVYGRGGHVPDPPVMPR